MAVVIDPVVHDYVMDPADYRPFIHAFARGPGGTATLGENDQIAGFTISPTPAAISAGFAIGQESGKLPQLLTDAVGFWPLFDEEANNSPAFDAPGTLMGVEISLALTDGQKIQRTGFIRAGQR